MVAKEAKEIQPLKLDYTIRLSRMVKKMAPKKRAPRAVREIKQMAQKIMGTTDVRIDPTLNEMIWSRGIHRLPPRVRVRFNRKRNEEEDAERFMTVVEHVECGNFKGLVAQVVKDN